MTFEEYLNIVDHTYNEGAFELRYGQTVMNILNQVWPEKYKSISRSELDCFYDDGTVRFTLDFLEKEWVNKPL